MERLSDAGEEARLRFSFLNVEGAEWVTQYDKIRMRENESVLIRSYSCPPPAGREYIQCNCARSSDSERMRCRGCSLFDRLEARSV